MAFEIHETFQYKVAKLEEMVHTFNEAVDAKTKHGLVIEIAAIHVGTTKNANHYPEESLYEACSSWVSPYQKPIIINHDLDTDPLGRVIGASVETDEDVPYIKLQAAITDPIAIERVIDKRYLTGSIGATAEAAVCSICETDWAKPPAKPGRLPCEHVFGHEYDGKKAVRILSGISFHEYSFVNAPSDQHSVIKGMVVPAEESFTFKPRVFDIGLETQEINEFDLESASKRIVNTAKPVFWQLKGSFLSAEQMNTGAFIDSYTTTEDITHIGDSQMAKIDDVNGTEIIPEEDEDILDVMTEAEAEDAEDTDQKEVDGNEVADADTEQPDDESSQDDDTEEDDSEDADAVDGNAEVADAETEEARKKADSDDSKDSDSGSKKTAAKKDDAKDDDAVSGNDLAADQGLVHGESDEEAEEESEDADSDETQPEPEDVDTEQLEQESSVEPIVSELQEKVQTLEEKNAKLVKALHKSLVERIVDAKVYRGLVTEDTRGEAVEEHLTRKPSSLMDTLKDLRAIPMTNTDVASLREQFNNTDLAAVEESNVETLTEDVVEAEPLKPAAVLENKLVDILMARTPYNNQGD